MDNDNNTDEDDGTDIDNDMPVTWCTTLLFFSGGTRTPEEVIPAHTGVT